MQFAFFPPVSDTEVLTRLSGKDWRDLPMNVLKRDIAAMKAPIKNSHYHTKNVWEWHWRIRSILNSVALRETWCGTIWYRHGMLFGLGFQKENNPHQLHFSVTTFEIQNKVMLAVMTRLSQSLAKQTFRLVNRGLEIFLLGNSREEMTS